jgi:hypothetical protein
MAAPKGAAKFREETPRKGGGVAERNSAIPRCSNMAETPGVCKKKFGPPDWKNVL